MGVRGWGLARAKTNPQPLTPIPAFRESAYVQQCRAVPVVWGGKPAPDDVVHRVRRTVGRGSPPAGGVGAGRATPGDAARMDRRAAGRGRWEWVLGIGLLLAVLLAGTVDWWQQEHGATAYHRGATAATAQHWAAAQAAFEQAGSVTAMPPTAPPWPAPRWGRSPGCMTRPPPPPGARIGPPPPAPIIAVAALQPDFREVATRLPAARARLIQQQATGTIYGTSGPTAGLYLARAGGQRPGGCRAATTAAASGSMPGVGAGRCMTGRSGPRRDAHGDRGIACCSWPTWPTLSPRWSRNSPPACRRRHGHGHPRGASGGPARSCRDRGRLLRLRGGDNPAVDVDAGWRTSPPPMARMAGCSSATSDLLPDGTPRTWLYRSNAARVIGTR